jgi:hypothetical protein
MRLPARTYRSVRAGTNRSTQVKLKVFLAFCILPGQKTFFNNKGYATYIVFIFFLRWSILFEDIFKVGNYVLCYLSFAF